MPRDDVLFFDDRGSLIVQGQSEKLDDEIAAYDADALLTAGIETLLEYFEQKYQIEVPLLREDAITVSQDEISADQAWSGQRPPRRTGTAFTYHVPYSGAQGLFPVRPSAGPLNPPRGFVTATELRIRIDRWSEREHNTVGPEFDGHLSHVKQCLDQLRKDFAPFNPGLRDGVRSRVQARRKKLLADRGTVASLGYPIRERVGAPRTYTVAVERRSPLVPPRGTGPFRPEPEFERAAYERTLEIMASMAVVMEQTPSTYAKLNETDLRNHFLFQLNAQFKGEATGETFRASGKTDIVVIVDGRAVLIAECKFYNGPKSVTDALDQLLGYTTWRDTKIALLFFSRQKDFSAVLRSIDESVRAHAMTRRNVQFESETGFRYVVSRPDDHEREMTLTVLAFAVPPGADA